MDQKKEALDAIDRIILMRALETALESSSDSSSSSSNDSWLEDSSSDEDDLLPLLLLRYSVENDGCTAKRKAIKASHKSMGIVPRTLPQLPDHAFPQQIRMSKSSFERILELVKNDDIFNKHNNAKCTPADQGFQLYVALYSFTSYGNSPSLKPVAAHFGVSEGTVRLYTSRIICALLKLEPKYADWPDENERRDISRRIKEKHRFPDCVGFFDGTLVPLLKKPAVQGEEYFSRKGKYAITVGMVCDDKMRIRHVISGYTGSVRANRVYGNCKLAKNPSNYFSGDEYLVGDNAYGISSIMIPPYKCDRSNVEFNVRHAKLRLPAESTCGMLKERFQSLKGLPIDVNCGNAHARCNFWIRACCVLHNIVLDTESRDTKDTAVDEKHSTLLEEVDTVTNH
ncbi:uncharacterized protein LOC129597350 [Paramacrobiotus metropolitanus]|uniref:uncharacterized protein LOC129597350 n=1 Tax=Paramacrobiotus metropolitanus TaxID=2943436 RepID=UPI002445A682|nr:uncharacterized protein LOC129597350 [Paramacrobiotus metropolitanus]